VNHRELIDSGLALANANDLRVYFRKDEDCRPTEIDRILINITTKRTTVLFKLQEDLSETVRDGSAYYLVYGNFTYYVFININCISVVRKRGALIRSGVNNPLDYLQHY
jgi:hypothetical protein